MSEALSRLVYSGELPSRHILRGKTAFQHLFHSGRSIAAKNVVLRYVTLPGRPGDKRVGFIVGKRLGKAVVRNRVKRCMREAYRTNKMLMARVLTLDDFGIYYAFIARNAVAGFELYRRDCCYLMQKLERSLSSTDYKQ